MLKRTKRAVAAAMATIFAVSMFIFTAPVTVEAAVSYPLQKPPKLTYWLGLNVNVSGMSKSLNDTPFAKGLMEKTGIEIEFIHPAVGQEREQFNLMISSGRMSDIVEFNWVSEYASGMDAAIKNNLAYKLNDKMADWAPDYKAYLDNNPDINRMVKTDSGNYFGFSFIRGAESLMVFHGPIIRKDWLDELKLSLPETIDDWTKVLTAFKTTKGASAPLGGEATSTDPLNMFGTGTFIGAYGVDRGFFRSGDTVKHGAIEPGYKEWLTQMNKWYKDGLLNKDFVTDKRAEFDAKFLSGETGATVGYAGSGIGTWLAAFQDVDPNAVIVGTKYPVLKKGETSMFGQKDFPVIFNSVFAVVNPKSKNIETAVKLLNYGYTTEGEMYYNFGTEGRDYEMKFGYPTMSESILKPATGSIGANWGQVARSVYGGPFVQRGEYFDQYMRYPIQVTSVSNWSKTNSQLSNLPPISVSESESREYSRIKANIDAYVGEWAPKAIMGTADISKFESEFVASLKEMGIEKAIEIQQAAYNRYLKR